MKTLLTIIICLFCMIGKAQNISPAQPYNPGKPVKCYSVIIMGGARYDDEGNKIKDDDKEIAYIKWPCNKMQSASNFSLDSLVILDTTEFIRVLKTGQINSIFKK